MQSTGIQFTVPVADGGSACSVLSAEESMVIQTPGPCLRALTQGTSVAWPTDPTTRSPAHIADDARGHMAGSKACGVRARALESDSSGSTWFDPIEQHDTGSHLHLSEDVSSSA